MVFIFNGPSIFWEMGDASGASPALTHASGPRLGLLWPDQLQTRSRQLPGRLPFFFNPESRPLAGSPSQVSIMKFCLLLVLLQSLQRPR